MNLIEDANDLVAGNYYYVIHKQNEEIKLIKLSEVVHFHDGDSKTYLVFENYRFACSEMQNSISIIGPVKIANIEHLEQYFLKEKKTLQDLMDRCFELGGAYQINSDGPPSSWKKASNIFSEFNELKYNTKIEDLKDGDKINANITRTNSI